MQELPSFFLEEMEEFLYAGGDIINKMPREAVTSRGAKLRYIVFEAKEP